MKWRKERDYQEQEQNGTVKQTSKRSEVKRKENRKNDWRTGASIPVPYRCERYALPIELVPHLTFFFPFPFLAFFSSFSSPLRFTFNSFFSFHSFFFHSLSFLCLFVYLFVNKSDSNVSTSLPSKFPSSFFFFLVLCSHKNP